MPILTAVALLLFCQLLGELLVRLTGAPLPGPLAGMVLLLLLLMVQGRVALGMQQTATHILRHMMLLFIPAIAGITMHLERLSKEWLPFIAASVLGAVITIFVTALTFRWALSKSARHDK